MRVPPEKEDEVKVKPGNKRSYVLFLSIGVSALFWVSLLVILFFVWKR
jgi:hypothetical protein